MANSVTARFNDDCKVFVSMSDDTTVEKAVIIDAEGNETDIGGGGGGSDFSTAEVTFISSADTYFVYISNVDNNSIILNGTQVNAGTPETLLIPLYKGKAITNATIFKDADLETQPEFTGDIAWGENYSIVITGNGSITLKGTN